MPVMTSPITTTLTRASVKETAAQRHWRDFSRCAEIHMDIRHGRQSLVLPSLLRVPAGPQYGPSPGARRDSQDHGILDTAWGVRVAHGRLAEDHSRADSRGRHHILLEPYGYRWYRVGGL